MLRLITSPRALQPKRRALALCLKQCPSRTFTVSIAHRDDAKPHPENKGLGKIGQAVKDAGSESPAPKSEKRKSRLERLRNREQANSGPASAKGDAKSKTDTRYILGQPSNVPIRTRFAPSPTGHMHLGSLRTALFNNVISKATKGQFVIRIEDTDQSRLVPGAEASIFRDLEWAQLSWDEGPDKGGPYGPYRQSERLDIYKEHIQTLLENGSAYRCFCSSDHLEAQKRAQHTAGMPTSYPGTCRSVSAEESDRRAADGETHIVRLNAGKFGRPSYKDAIYGPFEKRSDEEDFVLMKTDGYPTYHFASVVDDHLMKITHVVRGEEWLISTPKHLALYEAFGWTPPMFAHLGLLVADNGHKLSKRNQSVNLDTYRDQRIFPMALQSWLANLGSSYLRSTSGQVANMSVDDIADNLSFKFTRGGIKLDLKKLEWWQLHYRKTLLATPASARKPHEETLLDHLLFNPLIRHIHALADADSTTMMHIDGSPFAWPRPLELTPTLQDPTKQRDYISSILAMETTQYVDVTTVAEANPHYFFRPPLALYRAGLATLGLPLDFFHQLDDVLHDDGVPLEGLVHALAARADACAMSMPQLHGALRLIAAGDSFGSTRSTGLMLGFLGRDEWKHRSRVVTDLIKGATGEWEDVQRAWAQESEGLKVERDG